MEFQTDKIKSGLRDGPTTQKRVSDRTQSTKIMVEAKDRRIPNIIPQTSEGLLGELFVD